MIEVTYLLDKDESIICLEVSGHANYDEKGKDIVCSAVSAICVGGINAFDNLDGIEVNLDYGGYILIEGKGLKKARNQIVIEVILTQLLTIKKSYGRFINVSKR